MDVTELGKALFGPAFSFDSITTGGIYADKIQAGRIKHMPEMIMTRADVLAEAMQFEGTQKNVDEITQWINNCNPSVVVSWNGNDEQLSGELKIKAEPGLLEIYRNALGAYPMEAVPGDWVVKTSRDTFYTVSKKDFEEIWEVMH